MMFDSKLYLFCVLVLLLAVCDVYGLDHTDLVAAIREKNLVKFNEAITAKVNVNVQDASGFTPLVWACTMEDEAAVRTLLAHGANVNVVERDGWSPLHFSTFKGNLPITELLLANGADTVKANKQGSTPLTHALRSENEKLIAAVDTAFKLQTLKSDMNKRLNDRDARQPKHEPKVEVNGHLHDRGSPQPKHEPKEEVNGHLHDRGAPQPKHEPKVEVNGHLHDRGAPQPKHEPKEEVKRVDPPVKKSIEYASLLKTMRGPDINAFKAAVQPHLDASLPVEKRLNWSYRNEKGFSFLIFAAADGRHDLLEYLLQQPEVVKQINDGELDGWTPLMFAAVQGNEKNVDLLLNAGASGMIANKDGNNAIKIAKNRDFVALANRIASVCLLDLLKYGLTDAGRADSMLLDKFVDLITTNKINPNLVVPAPDYTGINALMLVSIRDHENGKAVESLVKLGADMYATDTRGWTSLMYASSAGNLDAASKLLSLSNFDMKLMTYVSNDGETALTLARKKKAVKVVALLEKHMPHVEHTALKNTQDTDSSLKRIKASPVQKGKYAVELVDAILKQNPSKVKEYLADGADYEFVGKGGYTPLLQAAAKGNVEIIKMLVDLGANVNAAENDGWISIMFPAFQGRLDVLDTLLDAGAEALTPNKFGKYAFDLALSNGHKKVAARIATEAMPAAIRKEDSSMIKRLLAAGGNPAAVDVSGGGRTPLMVLTRSNLLSAEDVEKFLNDYGTVDVNSADANGNTALFYAVDKGDVSIVAVLIAHGADTKHRNRAGKTVVEIAQSKSQTDVVNLLDRFPDAKAMQNALASLRNAQNNQGHSIQEAAFALSNPKIDATYLEQTAESTVDVDPVQEASALRKKNKELTENLEHLASKARQDYSAKAKQRAVEEKARKERILEAEKKKKNEANKGFFARLFGF